MSAYSEWLKELENLAKEAEFCLTDITENISSGNHVVNFLITEAVGHDPDMVSRRGRINEVCRPRIYIGLDKIDLTDPNGGRCEVKEPLSHVEKDFIRDYSFSLNEYFMFNSALCRSVLSSLRDKITLVSERSKALLESAVGDELVKMITARLLGEEISDTSLKNLVIRQVEARMEESVGVPIKELLLQEKVSEVKRLEIQDGEISWEYQVKNGGFDINLHWKGITFRWDDQNHRGNIGVNLDTLSVRNMFLYLVNLPSFGQIVARRLAKIIE